MLKLSIIESNLPNMADSLIKEKNLFSISDNVVKIGYNRLDYLNCPFFSAQSSFLILPNLNNKNKKG